MDKRNRVGGWTLVPLVVAILSVTSIGMTVEAAASDTFIIPGTKWCGRGNIAENFNETGVHYAADRCCREHDNCPEVIKSMASKLGFINWSPMTYSHCDCDHRFRACLKNSRSAMADLVGNLFYNVIKVKCFKIEGKCRRRMQSRGCVEWVTNSERVRVYQPTHYEVTYT